MLYALPHISHGAAWADAAPSHRPARIVGSMTDSCFMTVLPLSMPTVHNLAEERSDDSQNCVVGMGIFSESV